MPSNWSLTQLKDICDVKGGKRIPAGEKFSLSSTSHMYLRVTDMKDCTIRGCAYVDDHIYNLIKKYTINSGDIYITVAGTIGDVGIVPNKYNGANLTENADKLILCSAISKDWFLLYLQSNMCKKQIKDATTKVGQPKLAIKRIEDIIIGLPPRNEQEKIYIKTKNLLDHLFV